MRLLPANILLFCIELIKAQDTIPDIILKGHHYKVYYIDISKDNKHLLFTLAGRNEIFFWDYKSNVSYRRPKEFNNLM